MFQNNHFLIVNGHHLAQPHLQNLKFRLTSLFKSLNQGLSLALKDYSLNKQKKHSNNLNLNLKAVQTTIVVIVKELCRQIVQQFTQHHRLLKMVKSLLLFRIMMMAHQLQQLLLMEMMDQSKQTLLYPTQHILKMTMDTLKQRSLMMTVETNTWALPMFTILIMARYQQLLIHSKVHQKGKLAILMIQMMIFKVLALHSHHNLQVMKNFPTL